MKNFKDAMDEVETDEINRWAKLLEVTTNLDLIVIRRDESIFITHFLKIQTLATFIIFLEEENYTFYINAFDVDWFIKLELDKGTK
jgi:hypothetical protein